MTRVRITTPVPDHSGVVGNVFITDGVGHADSVVHAAEIAYCRRNGYTVEELPGEANPEVAAEIEATNSDDTEPAGGEATPRRNGSAEAWRAYAVAHGMSADEAEQLTRDQLVERFTSSSTEETTE